MPRFVSEFNAALSLQLTKGKWYHLRQPLSLKLQPLPWYRWLQMKNSCCQPDRKNMEISSPEEKHRAAQSREFWQSQTTLKTNDIGGGIQILYSARKYCINLFLRNLSVVNGTQPSYFYLFFFFSFLFLLFFIGGNTPHCQSSCDVIQEHPNVMFSRCAQTPGQPPNRGVFFKAADLHGKASIHSFKQL